MYCAPFVEDAEWERGKAEVFSVKVEVVGAAYVSPPPVLSERGMGPTWIIGAEKCTSKRSSLQMNRRRLRLCQPPNVR